MAMQRFCMNHYPRLIYTKIQPYIFSMLGLSCFFFARYRNWETRLVHIFLMSTFFSSMNQHIRTPNPPYPQHTQRHWTKIIEGKSRWSYICPNISWLKSYWINKRRTDPKNRDETTLGGETIQGETTNWRIDPRVKRLTGETTRYRA